MLIQDFKSALESFADSPADLDLSRGRLIVQVRDELIEASVSQRDGELWVDEAGEHRLATSWLINRVARLPVLADRILSYVPPIDHFVEPSGQLLDQPDYDFGQGEIEVPDAVETIKAILDRRAAGASSVVYLTSDAGEGKTTVINYLARVQAERYKRKEADWLLLPVTLGGRAFLRFDDVVIATLVNRLRFQLLYFEGFLELTRRGVLVPAFDGFEEMFVESSSGEALSEIGRAH